MARSSLGQALARARLHYGETLCRAARGCGVRSLELSAMEQGRRPVTDAVIRYYSSAFRLDYAEAIKLRNEGDGNER